MKKFRFALLFTTALAFVLVGIIAIRGQQNETEPLVRLLGNWTTHFDVIENEQTGETSASFTNHPSYVFRGVAYSWDVPEIETSLIEDVPTAADHSIARRWEKVLSLTSKNWDTTGFSGRHYELRNEGDHTVLHLYIYAPADTMKNFWLASDETAIVDLKTGKNYRAIRTVPDCFGKYFTFKCKRGTVLDFQIYFPKLPRSTTKIAIYGVPYLSMNGERLTLDQKNKKRPLYDDKPRYHAPKLAKEESEEYDSMNERSWAVYNDVHLIKPVEEGTMALWRTPDATYVAYAYEQNWTREQFGSSHDLWLIDDHDFAYKVKDVLGFPANHNFWIEGYSGDCVAIIYVFEPISTDIEEVYFKIGKYADPKAKIRVFSIEELRDNQALFEYKKRHMVES